jgi:hypothetical protein
MVAAEGIDPMTETKGEDPWLMWSSRAACPVEQSLMRGTHGSSVATVLAPPSHTWVSIGQAGEAHALTVPALDLAVEGEPVCDDSEPNIADRQGLAPPRD